MFVHKFIFDFIISWFYSKDILILCQKSYLFLASWQSPLPTFISILNTDLLSMDKSYTLQPPQDKSITISIAHTPLNQKLDSKFSLKISLKSETTIWENLHGNKVSMISQIWHKNNSDNKDLWPHKMIAQQQIISKPKKPILMLFLKVINGIIMEWFLQ